MGEFCWHGPCYSWGACSCRDLGMPILGRLGALLAESREPGLSLPEQGMSHRDDPAGATCSMTIELESHCLGSVSIIIIIILIVILFYLSAGWLPSSETTQRPRGQCPCFRKVRSVGYHPRPSILHSDGRARGRAVKRGTPIPNQICLLLSLVIYPRKEFIK